MSLLFAPPKSLPAGFAFFAPLLSLLLITVLDGPVAAGEVQWRQDYNKARREATEKNRPLLLDIGTSNCIWCRKLEATTFRDVQIAAVLNDQFIPLKVDANREAALAEALKIESYPTLVLAAPDGKILGIYPGYVDAAKLGEILQKALASLDSPEWMNRDYQLAAKAIAGSDYSRAIALLKSITEDGKERAVQVKARQLLQDLEQQAADRLARAKQLDDRGQSAEAVHTLSELLRLFAGTQATVEAGQLLTALAGKPEVKAQMRKNRARELLAQAREDYRTQQYLGCLDRCELLSSSYADLPEGMEALQLAAEIKNNPEWLQKACDALADRLGGFYLALAEARIKKGDIKQAAQCLQQVVQQFPGTRQAETAQVRLSALQGRPTWQAEFQKP
jgi:thioredoxin-like negative regulator of GroEL